MKFAAIGDNCIDHYTFGAGTENCYERFYPTGNAVDTAVNVRKLGIPTAIISTTGSDEYGDIMKAALKKEDLDMSHFYTAEGPTAITYMKMNGNDRVHDKYVQGVLADMKFTDEDVKFAASHDIVHTALWGNAQDVLPAIKAAGGTISFDYADEPDNPLVESTLPYVDYGFYSYGKPVDDHIKAYLKDKVDRGMKIAVATMGELGSIAYDGKEYYQFGIVPAPETVNTVGAGDSYISGFLAGIMQGLPIIECMALGAKVASGVVSVFEPWEGYVPEEDL